MGRECDVAVVRAAQKGDPKAQDELVAAYLPLVYNIVGRALNGHADVDDVVQETFVRALQGLGSLREPESFRSWLVAIATNRIRDLRQVRRSAPDEGGLRDAWDVADPGADFVDLTIIRLGLSGQRQEVAEATRWLDPDDRALLALWWLEAAEELTREEVARAMELTPQHTAVRVQRMKAQLETARVVVRALAAVPRCVLLQDVVAGWDGRPSALWRKRLARHARGCTVCSGHQAGLVPAERLLVALGLVPVSAGLLAVVGPDATDSFVLAAHDAEVPDAGSLGADVSGGAGSPGADVSGGGGGAHRVGGTRRAGRPGARRRPGGRRRTVVASAVAVLVAGGTIGVVVLTPGGGPEPSGPKPPVEAEGPVLKGSLSSAPASPPPSASPSGSPSASPSPSRTAPSPPTPPPTPTKTPERPEPPATPQPPAPGPPGGGQVVDLVNAERARAGCGPVRHNDRLETAAARHSADMAARDYFDHTDPDGGDPGDRMSAAGYSWSTYGENIARGQQSASDVVGAWMDSPGHRANILNCSFEEMGVGKHTAPGGPWWTQVFGTQR
ncbi:sigma-70 family RNA polymerase sigma factor [Streptomyces sp. GSL17-111]|uniref:sigma-70 family RNA polymerase sigma factor n=1 Tax=Streptomyces sp. GSL17-111 TaxID=3121596 RepID=UPI0030F41F88